MPSHTPGDLTSRAPVRTTFQETQGDRPLAAISSLSRSPGPSQQHGLGQGWGWLSRAAGFIGAAHPSLTFLSVLVPMVPFPVVPWGSLEISIFWPQGAIWES